MKYFEKKEKSISWVPTIHSIIHWFVHSFICSSMAPHSSTLAWKIPWMEEPGGLQSMGSLRVGHDWATLHFHALEKKMATHSSVLAWRIPGTVEPGGLASMRSHRVGHDWSDLAAAAAAVGYQTEDKSLFIALTMKKRYYCFAVPSGLMDLGLECQLLLTL